MEACGAGARVARLQSTKLLEAVRRGDVSALETLLQRGVHDLVNYLHPIHLTSALIVAVTDGNSAVAERLLCLGADPDLKDTEGRTAVMHAASQGYDDAVTKLIEFGASVDIVDQQQCGVAFYSLGETENHTRCLETVVNAGADVTSTREDGQPVMLAACESARIEQCLFLLERGADPNSKHAITKKTSLMAAASRGSVDLCRALLAAGCAVDDVTDHVTFKEKQLQRNKMEETRAGTHAVHEAARAAHVKVLQILSAYGANFSVQDEDGNTSLHLAAAAGLNEICVFLTQRGCDARLKNKSGLKARTLAAAGRHKPAAATCRRAEKNLSSLVEELWAVRLYDFCTEQRPTMLDRLQPLDVEETGALATSVFLKVLIEVGAPLPAGAKLSGLLLKHEVARKSINYQLFLSGTKYTRKSWRRAGLDELDQKSGRLKLRSLPRRPAPLFICRRPRSLPVGSQTTQEDPRWAPPYVELCLADVRPISTGRPGHVCSDDRAWYANRRWTTSARLSDVIRHGELSALDRAMKSTDRDVINDRDELYKSALMTASAGGRSDIVERLIHSGAAINAVDNLQWSALHFACAGGHTETVVKLLDAGAWTDTPSVTAATPLVHAVTSSRPKLVQLLIDRGASADSAAINGVKVRNLAAAYGDRRVYDVIDEAQPSRSVGERSKKAAKKKSSK